MQEKLDSEAENLIADIRSYAERLYKSKQLLCAEAALVALNEGLKGGLSDRQAVAMAAPFSMAMGESGCLCGALGGSLIGVGLLLGENGRHLKPKHMRGSARQLHDAFKEAHGSTCCRVLSRKVRHDKKAHFQQCSQLTADATERAARLILKRRPEPAKKDEQKASAKDVEEMPGALSRVKRLFL